MDTAVIDAIVAFLTGTFGPQFAIFILVIGIFRTVFKPTMELSEAVVSVTPTKTDDTLVESVKTNKWYLMFVWVIDYLTSVKLPK